MIWEVKGNGEKGEPKIDFAKIILKALQVICKTRIGIILNPTRQS